MTPPAPRQGSHIHSFDIDASLNPYLPRPRFHCLPRPISHFLGFRPAVRESTSTIPLATQTSTLYVWLFSFLGAFVGISIIEQVYQALPLLDGHDVPLVIASFGAAAILEYNTIESPLAQPRNLIAGHLISAVIGVGITKLFQLLPPHRFQDLRWLAGALSVASASATMAITKTVHPPAGATALLAATSPEITQLGWWLPALVVLGSSLMLASALLINNLYKRFPLYWWTAVNLDQVRSEKRRGNTKTDEIVNVSDLEQGKGEQLEAAAVCRNDSSTIDTNSEATLHHNSSRPDHDHDHDTDHRDPRLNFDTTVPNNHQSNTSPTSLDPDPDIENPNETLPPSSSPITPPKVPARTHSSDSNQAPENSHTLQIHPGPYHRPGLDPA